MTTSHVIGEITLSISSFFYLLWFVPQIRLNLRRKSTEGLSFWLHGLLFVGYGCDLIYGFGLHMQWQYRCITLSGLVSLSIQHMQFARYDFLQSAKHKLQFVLVTVLIVILLVVAIAILLGAKHSTSFYNAAGMTMSVCCMIYMLPQIIKNSQRRSTIGLSTSFVLISILMGSFDLMSALLLNWNWPSVVGPIMGLTGKLILIAQIIYYMRLPQKSL